MKCFLCSIFYFWACLGHAQNFVQTLKGRITDAESRQPLVGANVVINATLAGQTDAEGYFKISNVPVGRQAVVVSLVGYETARLQEVLVGAGKEVELNVALTERVAQLNEVQIKAQREQGAPLNDMATVSARSFSVEQVKQFAAAMNDPARMALSFAGVATNGDQTNALVVRGNTPKGILWRMEGVEIPNPNHFAEEGATGGGISALSVNVLANSDFFTGAFPAEYGNATSGVFDLKLRAGNHEKREYAAQMGIMGLDMAAEGPFKKGYRGSYLVNYRYSTLQILKQIGFSPAGDDTPDFQDVAFKIYLPARRRSTFSLWGMGGLSQNTRDRTDRFNTFNSDRGVIGLNWLHW